ncbi:MAG: N-formylglutamate amidohydrolase [Bdellovibrionales bacterium]
MKSVLSIQKPKTPQTEIKPLIFDSPHSGNHYPDDFDFACDRLTLERAEDNHVDDLFNECTNHGAHYLCAHFPRSYVDVNRKHDDIDMELLKEEWMGDFDINPTSRSHAGIGLIRRLVRPGIPIYNRDLTSEEIIYRIERYYRPYHNTLADLIETAHYNFGQAWHVNCHSMPAASAYPRQVISLMGNKPKPSDFVLGDRDGTTCDPAFTRALRDFIKGLGYTVTINDPFKGVELIEKYSNPTSGYHSIQIEINKALYMNEETNERNANYNQLKSHITDITAFIANHIENRLFNLAAD